MRLHDHLLFGIRNLFRRKKNTMVNIAIISLSIVVLLGSFTIADTISTFIEKNIDKNIEYRAMFVRYDVTEESLSSAMEKLSEIDNVYKVLEQEEYQTTVNINEFKSEKTDGEIHLVGSNKELTPSIIAGRNIEDDDAHVLICPINFIAAGNLDSRNDLNRNNYLNGKKFLNTEVTVTYNSYDYSEETPKILKEYSSKFKVIGLYDAYDSYSELNVCYTSFSDVEKINKLMKGNMDEYTEKVYWHPIVIVDDSKNVEKVSKEIINLGYTPQQLLNINTKLSTNIKNICVLLAIITSIVSFISIILYVIKALKGRENEIGLLKAIGYKNKDIFVSLLIETLLIGIICFLITFIIYTILYFFAYYLTNYSSIIWSRFIVKYSYLGILLSLTYTVVIPIVCSAILSNKISKINPIDIMRDK